MDYEPQRMAVLKVLEDGKKKEITIDEIPDEFKIFFSKDTEKANSEIRTALNIAESRLEVRKNNESEYQITMLGRFVLKEMLEKYNEIKKANTIFEVKSKLKELLVSRLDKEKAMEKLLEEKKELKTDASLLETLADEILKEIEKEREKKLMEYFSGESLRGKFIPQKLAEDILSEVKIITLRDSEEMYYYDVSEGIWKPNAEALIKEKVAKKLGDKCKTHYINETLSFIQAVTYVDRSVFDNIPVNLIPVENGVLKVDFETGNVELLPLSPQYFFTSKLPVKYDPEAKCPKIEKFLSEIVEPENKQLLIEAIAYTLYRDNPWRKMFLLVGEGANGKTTFLTLLERFLGIRNISSRSMFELVEERFAKADLYRKWANICDELPYGRLLTTEVIKRLTGQSLVTAENKFKNSFQFKFWGKMIFSGNILPKVFEESSAFYDRLILIIFPYRFVEKPMAENEKPVNKNLINEITTEEELSGLLNLALQNLPKVLKEGFSYAKRVDEVRELYTKVSDPVAAFVMEKIETDPESWIPKDELYTAFVLYCKQNKLPILANNVFSRELKVHIRVEEVRKKIGGKRMQGWQGIKIKKEDDEEVQSIIDEIMVKLKDLREQFKSSFPEADADKIIKESAGDKAGKVKELLFEQGYIFRTAPGFIDIRD